MGEESGGIVHVISDLGTVGTHPATKLSSLYVGTTTNEEYNVLGLPLKPVGCLALRDVLFDFDSSFVAPDIANILKYLPARRAKHQNIKGELPPLSLFGHADPVGDDTYNKHLSGRRAKAVFGLLTHQTKIWDELFDQPFQGDNWKTRNAIKTMADFLGLPKSTPRAKLFDAYMTALCPFVLQPEDFLGRGQDAKGKADYQGCSEFNPLIVLSDEENKKLKRAQRDQENLPNRRVLIFLFPAGSKVNPEMWPCPRAHESTAGCRLRFFETPLKGDDRRQAGAERREFSRTKDTFACRFYDGFAHDSPCEAPVQNHAWVRFQVRDAKSNAPVRDVELIVRSANGEEFPVVTDINGKALVENLAEGLVDVYSPPSSEDSVTTLSFVALGPSQEEEETTSNVGIRLQPIKAPTSSGNRRRIGVLKLEPENTERHGFVQIDGREKSSEGATTSGIKPFHKEGLATDEEHEIRVAPLESFTFFLRDEHDFPIPEAEYEITLADLTIERGLLDLRGKGVVWNPPDGPFEIRYPNLDDVKAKSLAGRVRKACVTGDINEFYKVLLYSPSLIENANTAYDKYFNNLSGKGMSEDLQNAIHDSDLLLMIQILMTHAGLPTRPPNSNK